MRRTILTSLGARALRTLTAANSRRGRYPAREQNADFLGPDPHGKAARTWHIRDKRTLTRRLREFFLWSPALGRTVGVRVLLPGIPAESSPVIHLLHGGGDDFRSWTDFGAAEALTGNAPYLVVMPDAGAGTYSRVAVGSEVHDWPRFHTEEIPAFLADTYSVERGREHQLLAGLSMGGYGAMKYAAWHPDRYGSAAAFSSPLDPLTCVPVFDITAMREGARPGSLFGDPHADVSEWIANSPYGLAENLRDTELWFSSGTGSLAEVVGARSDDLLETLISQQGERFSARLNALGIRHSWFPRTTGLHTWAFWQREFEAWLTTMERRRSFTGRRGDEAGPRRGGSSISTATPESRGADSSFTHLSGQAMFEIRGWRVEISRRRAQIVRFGDVGAGGFTLTGTGSFRVRTPPLYSPGEKYAVVVETLPASVEAERHGDTAHSEAQHPQPNAAPDDGREADSDATSAEDGTGPVRHEQRADRKGRLTFTGRLAAAMHDPIIPGPRTRHFTTVGRDRVTRVRIRSIRSESTIADADVAVGTGPEPLVQDTGDAVPADDRDDVRGVGSTPHTTLYSGDVPDSERSAGRVGRIGQL